MKLEQVANWSEIVASVAVVITLVLLMQDVKTNTLAIERQVAMDRGVSISTPFFQEPGLAGILAKIRDVDGEDPLLTAFVDRYGFSQEEAILWTRHLGLLWNELEADYLYGQPEDAVAMVQGLLAFPDNQIYVEHTVFSAPFRDLIRALQPQ